MVKKYLWPWIDVNEYGPHISTWIKSKLFLDLDELRGKGSFFLLCKMTNITNEIFIIFNKRNLFLITSKDLFETCPNHITSIACINHMSCLSTMTANIISIASSKTNFVSIIHCFWPITKNLSLLLCTNKTNHMLLRTNMIRWTKILWGINNFGHDKCSNQSSQIKALIPFAGRIRGGNIEEISQKWEQSQPI